MNVVGILPAAGKGSRLRLPYPKELAVVTHLEGYVITVLESNLKQLANAGITEAVIVISPEKEIIRTYLGNWRQGVKLRYAYQTTHYSREGLPDAVLAARPLVQDFDLCVMLMADVYFTDPNTVRWLTTTMTHAQQAQVGVSVWETLEPWRFGVVELDDTRVVRVTDKPQYLTPPQKFWGAVAFRPAFWRYLETEKDTFSAALHRAAQDMSVVDCPAAGEYLDLGTPLSLIDGIVTINRS